MDQVQTNIGAPANGNGVRRKAAHGRNFSYFSHRVFVSFLPADLHDYLERLLEVVADETPPKDPIAPELVRWVLLHRAKLNALALNREIESMRGPGDLLQLADKRAFRIHLTLQFAVELELAKPEVVAWLDTRPGLQQTVLDAAYYVSREWTEQDRSVGIALDLTEKGLPAFSRYLLHRMNLHEDETAPGQNDTPSDLDKRQQEQAQLDARALSTQEIDFLYTVARGVASTLAFSTDAEALALQWKGYVASSRPGRLSSPTNALYDALLVRPDTHVLVLESGSDKDKPRFLWRYLPSGKASEATSLRQILGAAEDKAHGPLVRVNRVASLLQTLQGPSATEPGTVWSVDWKPLGPLSEQHHVLPTTPNAGRAAAARAAIELAKNRRFGDESALQAELQTLREYADVLDSASTFEAVWRLLVNSACVGGRRSAPTCAEALHTATPLLSSGLRLDACRPPDVLKRLEEFQRQVQDHLNVALVAPPGLASSKPDWTALPGAVEAAFKAGLGSISVIDQSELIPAAWQSAERRLQSPTDTSAADASEIICADANGRLGGVLDLHLGRMNLRHWTAALTKALAPPGPAPGTEPGVVPLWLAAHALARLGMGGLHADAQAAVISGIAAAGHDTSRLRESGLALWHGQGGSARIALVICHPSQSLTDAWADAPKGGLVLVAPPLQAAELIERSLAAWVRGVGSPLLLVWEPMATSPQEEKTLRRQLAPWFGAQLGMAPSVKELWLYRGQGGKHKPHLVDPSHPDDLWAA
jgi:hypothetical protein